MEDVEIESTIVDTEVSVSWWCRACSETVVMVVDPLSGVVGWGADGDFGCNGAIYGTEAEGVGSHIPTLDSPRFREYWANRNG